MSRRGPSGAGERAARALTQERAQRTLRRLPAGRTAAASRRPGEPPPSFAHPRGLPGHGKPSTAARSVAHSPAVKDQLTNNPLRPGRGLGVPNPQGMRQPTPAPPGTRVRLQELERSAEPPHEGDGGPERRLAAQQSTGAVQRQRCIRRCSDRSAGGCADRRTCLTTRARACGGLDAAEASPPRCVR